MAQLLHKAAAYMLYRVLHNRQAVNCPLPVPCPTQTPGISFPLLVYSHRGGSLENDNGRKLHENTLEAFAYSARLNVDLLELDVQLTKDGKVVVFHDHELGRMCGPRYQGLKVADFSWEDLPPIQAHPGSMYQVAAEHHSEQGITATTSKIPLLSQVFEQFPSFSVQIDVKVQSPGLVQAVNSLVQQHQMEDRVLWGSFVHSVNNECYRVNSKIPLFTSAPRGLYLLASYYAGYLDKVPIYESAIILPWRLRLPLLGHYTFLDQGCFNALKQRGLTIVVYGNINDPDVFGQCLKAGASALCTDRPALLQSYLKELQDTGR